MKSLKTIPGNDELYVLFPALGFGQEQRAAGQCQGNDLWLKSAKKKSKKTDIQTLCHAFIFSLQKTCDSNISCLFLTILQAKEELLILQQLLYGVQAYVDGVHINQRLQDIGAQPSSTTRCFSVVKYP